MADALVSPAVGGVLWAASGGCISISARCLSRSPRDDLVPTMGVLGAFVFAAQMINFAIPGTGSSGHLGGGLLLAILLGPHAALLVMASVLTVQAFFFADGGILALGGNIMNLGCIPAFIAYPLVYRVLAGRRQRPFQTSLAMVLAAVAAVQLGAAGVVLETWASGISELPLRPFLVMMLPIHLVIGLVEGLATVAIVSFVARARPGALSQPLVYPPRPGRLRPVLLGAVAATVLTGGVLSWFASERPDGLEWATAAVSGDVDLASAASEIHQDLAAVQDSTALLPGYSFRGEGPAPRVGTSLSGLVGGGLALGVACLVGFLFRARALPPSRGDA